MTRKVFQADFGSQADQMVLSAPTNPIHNGGFNVWQRGASFASVINGQYTADRWWYTTIGAAAYDVLRSTDVPAVAALVPLTNYSLHLDVTTAAAAVAAGEYRGITQSIEGYTWASFAQAPFAIGFWVKDTITGTHCVALRNAGVDRSCVLEYTVSVADTWEYKTVAVPASPSAGTWLYTTGAGVYVSWILGGGSTYQTTPGAWQVGHFLSTANQVNSASSTANNFKLWGVTLGLGTTVAPFWPRSFGEELALCKRYCEVFGGDAVTEPFALGFSTSTTNASIHLPLQEKRTSPSLTVSSASNFMLNPSNTALSSLTSSVVSRYNIGLTAVVASGLTASTPQWLLANSTTSARLTVSADL